MSSFSIDEQDKASVREEITVPVRRGDDVIGDRVVSPAVLKIDVEGFELFVLRGLDRFIARQRPPILIEIEPRYLRRAGVDEDQQFAFFAERDYLGYAVTPAGTRRRPSFSLRPVKAPNELHGDIDVLWLPALGGRFDPSPYIVGAQRALHSQPAQLPDAPHPTA